jgi:hypothetical protein
MPRRRADGNTISPAKGAQKKWSGIRKRRSTKPPSPRPPFEAPTPIVLTSVASAPINYEDAATSQDDLFPQETFHSGHLHVPADHNDVPRNSWPGPPVVDTSPTMMQSNFHFDANISNDVNFSNYSALSNFTPRCRYELCGLPSTPCISRWSSTDT